MVLIIAFSIIFSTIVPGLLAHYNVDCKTLYFICFLVVELLIILGLLFKLKKTEKFYKVVRIRILVTLAVCLLVSVTGLPLIIDNTFRPELSVEVKCMSKFNCGECAKGKCKCDYCASNPKLTSIDGCEQVEEIECVQRAR